MPKETSAERTERLGLVQAYQESGQSYAEFGRERGVSPWKVRHAVRKTEQEGGGNPFTEVSAAAGIVGGGGSFQVMLRNGRELSIPAHFSEKRVRQLIGILESC
jgi:hypothetical protein